MVCFKNVINHLILNEEWVGFIGDSETETEFGSWSLISVGKNKANDYVFDLTEDVPNLNGEYFVKNSLGHVCEIRLSY